MMGLGEAADIRWWYEFLTDECDLVIGKDWCWGWKNDAWAVEFTDAKQETRVRLKLRNDA